jgi:hypothetical protein
MCRCCILHCNGKCHKQKTRVVDNDGKSIYSGHCNIAEICMASLSKNEFEIELKKFEKREKSNVDNRVDNFDEVDGILIYVWGGVNCDSCNMSMIGAYFYRIEHKQNSDGYFDYCRTCYENTIITDKWYNEHDIIVWTLLKCPYDGPDAILYSDYMSESE